MKKCFVFLLLIQFYSYGQSNNSTKPWTYWWWMGSTVNKPDIKIQLQEFSKAGLGGVHIIPIYGVKGYENQAIPFLSEKWLNMMRYTVEEGERLGLGVDLTTGTGWPFGGPNVTASMAAKTMKYENGKQKIGFTKQMVKRAALGGEGPVLDPFHPTGMERYLMRFDSAFAGQKSLPRAMYMDSYEAYGANWTVDFVNEFKARRAYDIQAYLPLFFDSTANEASELVKIDYHQTLSELLLERYAKPWTEWSRKHQFITRYQAHGSPGNLLDLYDATDVPETESFGTSRFEIPGLRIDPDYSVDQFGTPNVLAMKFASSAAHFSGKKWVSSETGTWLANHFKVSLSQVKPQIDELFTAGINHVFYHGTTYSPPQEKYPGWLFYASTNFGPTSHFSEYFPLLNQYITNCQNLLQNSKPDNDVLLYFPIQDLWSTSSKSSGGVHLLEVHHVDRWLLELPFGKLSETLLKQGFNFDYVSDKQLERLTITQQGELSSGSSVYKTLLLPSITYMSMATLDRLIQLAESGARIVFAHQFPTTVMGSANHMERQKEFLSKIEQLKGYENVLVSSNIKEGLQRFEVLPESFSAHGLSFIRKKVNGSTLYFVVNLGAETSSYWQELGKKGNFVFYNPLTGKYNHLSQRQYAGKKEYLLELLPGESRFIMETTNESVVENLKPIAVESLVLNGNWSVQFEKGTPKVPGIFKMTELKSWTSLSDSAVFYTGKASYKHRFDIPENAISSKNFKLDLGDVREIAEVRINGKSIGVAWSIPYVLDIPSGLLKLTGNDIEILVSNLSANYMRLRDKQQPEWKKFYDINIVDITYGKFDAAKWDPMPSGLLSPVKILY